MQKVLAVNPMGRMSATEAMDHSYVCGSEVNIFGSVRGKLEKGGVNVKGMRKQHGTSLDKQGSRRYFKSLHK